MYYYSAVVMTIVTQNEWSLATRCFQNQEKMKTLPCPFRKCESQSIYKQLNDDKQIINTVFKKRESTGQGAYLCVQDARMLMPDDVLVLLLFLHLQNPF